MSYFDAATFRRALAGPGMDTRTWLSYGTVAEDSPDAHSVRFNDDEGQPFPEGPLVTVVLGPSGVTVVCRVASMCAGLGESEWHPFVQGDEVLVAIPQGNTHAGCMIIGRGNNALDTFPATVAGQDATQNTFGFKRMRAPFIIETAASYLIRSATTGAQFGIDSMGQVIFNDGDGARFFMGPQAIGISTPDGSTSIQCLVETQEIAMTAGNTASFLLNAAASQFMSQGTLTLLTSGIQGTQHALSVEQLIAILSNMIAVMANLGAFSVGSPFDAAVWSSTAVAATNALWAAVLPATTTPVPYGISGAPGGFMGPLAPSYASLIGALGNPLFPHGEPTGLFPGVGRAGLLI